MFCQGMKMIPVYRNTLQGYFQIGDDAFGLFLSVMTGAGVFTVLPGGMLVDRYGPRRVLRVTLAGVACAFALVAASGKSWTMLVIAAGVSGLSLRPLIVAVNSYLLALFPNHRRRALSFNFAGTSVGALFFPAIAEGLLQVSDSIQAVSFPMILHGPYVALAPLILAAGFLYRKRTALGDHSSTKNVPPWSFRNVLIAPRYFFIVVLMLMHATADTVIHLWMPRFLGGEAFPSTPIGPGYVLSGFAVAYICARITLGILPEHFGRRTLLVLPGVLGGAVFIAGILSRDYWLTAGGYVVGAFLWSVEFPSMLSLLGYEEPRRFGAAMSFFSMLSCVSAFICLNGVGQVATTIPGEAFWKIMLVPATVFPCISIGALLWLLKFGHTLSSTHRNV